MFNTYYSLVRPYIIPAILYVYGVIQILVGFYVFSLSGAYNGQFMGSFFSLIFVALSVLTLGLGALEIWLGYLCQTDRMNNYVGVVFIFLSTLIAMIVLIYHPLVSK